MTTPPLPGRYGGDEAQPDDGEPFEEKVARSPPSGESSRLKPRS